MKSKLSSISLELNQNWIKRKIRISVVIRIKKVLDILGWIAKKIWEIRKWWKLLLTEHIMCHRIHITVQTRDLSNKTLCKINRHHHRGANWSVETLNLTLHLFKTEEWIKTKMKKWKQEILGSILELLHKQGAILNRLREGNRNNIMVLPYVS